MPRRGKSGCPGVSAPTEDIFKGYNVGAGLVPARGAGRPWFWLQSAAREGPPMKEIALYTLDIAQNSITAQAKRLDITLT